MKKDEWNGAATCADHGQTALPREGGNSCCEGRVHPHTIQNKCRTDSITEIAYLTGSVRTARYEIVGAKLAGQLQSGFA